MFLKNDFLEGIDNQSNQQNYLACQSDYDDSGTRELPSEKKSMGRKFFLALQINLKNFTIVTSIWGPKQWTIK